MRKSPQSLLPYLLLSLVVLAGSLAFGQSVFTCSSDDMGYHTCRVGPNDGIRMVRQRSDSACIAGQTYGMARDGVWVDRGCRADFEVFQNNGNNSGYNSRQGTWNDRRDRDDDHDADDNHHHHHDRDRSYNGAYNSGYNNGPYYNGGYVNSGQIQYLGRYHDGKSMCSSQPGQGQTFCQSGGPFRDAELLKENGANPCVRGQNWNVDPQNGLWIADGCSGQFKIEK